MPLLEKSSPLMGYVSTEIAASLVLALILYGASWALKKLSSRKPSEPGEESTYQFWLLTIRNILIAVFVLGLIVIWRKELQSVILALGAAAAGCIIGFKEQWQSLIAFWVRVVKNTYNLHDFIEVENVRGKVIDITWLTTAIAELRHDKDPLSFTGKVVHIPNHKMLNSNLLVHNLTGAYSVHTVEIPLPKGAHILKAKQVVQDVANQVCLRYIDAAASHMRTLRASNGIDTPNAAPRVRLHLGNEGTATLLVRIVVPLSKRARVEQKIVEMFLEHADAEAWPRIILK